MVAAAADGCSRGTKIWEHSVAARAAQSCESRGNHRHLVDRQLFGLVEPAAEPARAGAHPTLPVVRSDERAELECFAEVDTANLAGGLFGEPEVAAVERSAEDGARVPVGGDGAAPSRGRAGPPQCREPVQGGRSTA
jgi:hypothetical protein